MSYNELLADRIRDFFEDKKIEVREMKMMGGLCFMVDEKMCVGIVHNKLMARIGEEQYKTAIQIEGVNPMDFTKRPMKGYVFVSPEKTDLDDNLHYFLQMALDFNPLAKSSKKRKK